MRMSLPAGCASALRTRATTQSQALVGTATGPREVIIETGYLAEITPWLRLQPDVQYVVSPGGDASRGDAYAVCLRIKTRQ